MTRSEFEGIQLLYKKNQHICVVIDRSGSMSGFYMDLAKENALKLGKTYYMQNNTDNVKISTLLFDDVVECRENQSQQDYINFISGCQARGGTTFRAPLDFISSKIDKDGIKVLHTLFLTDGCDNTPEETRKSSETLKQKILKKEIISKFSVIGLGNHEADLMSNLLTIGNERGVYASLNQNQSAQEKEKIMGNAFETFINSAQLPNGIPIMVENKIVMLQCKDNIGKGKSNDILHFKKENIIVQNKGKDMVKEQVKMHVTAKKQNHDPYQQYSALKQPQDDEINWQIEDSKEDKEDKLYLAQYNSNMKQLDEIKFNQNPQIVAEEIKQIEENLCAIKPPSNDVLLSAHHDKIKEKVQRLRKKFEEAKVLDNEKRAELEIERNDMIKENDKVDKEVRFRKVTDIEKGSSYLLSKVYRDKEFEFQARACGGAIDNLNNIIQRFQERAKDFNIIVQKCEPTPEKIKITNSKGKEYFADLVTYSIIAVKEHKPKVIKPKNSLIPKGEITDQLPLYVKQQYDTFLKQDFDVQRQVQFMKQNTSWVDKTFLFRTAEEQDTCLLIIENFRQQSPGVEFDIHDQRVKITGQRAGEFMPFTKRVITVSKRPPGQHRQRR